MILSKLRKAAAVVGVGVLAFLFALAGVSPEETQRVIAHYVRSEDPLGHALWHARDLVRAGRPAHARGFDFGMCWVHDVCPGRSRSSRSRYVTAALEPRP